MDDQLTAEEERLMRHIVKKPAGGRGQPAQKPNYQQAKKPEPTSVAPQNTAQSNRPKWAHNAPAVDPVLKKKAEEEERQRQAEYKKQDELERKLREQNKINTGRNDFSIDRFLIKTEAPSSNLKSGNYEEEAPALTNKTESDDSLTKEEQRLMKKVGEKSKPKLYTPEVIEEHKKKLESQVAKPGEAPTVARANSGPTPKQRTAAAVSQKLLSARLRQPKSVSSISSAAEWLIKFNASLTKVQGSLLFTENNFNDFNYANFEEGSVGLVNFVADNLVALDHEKNPIGGYEQFITCGSRLVEKLASSNQWSSELENLLVDTQKNLFELVSKVLYKVKLLEYNIRSKEERNSHLSTVLVQIFQISQNMNTANMNYHPLEFKQLLKELIEASKSTYDLLEDKNLDEVVERTHNIIEAAKQFMANHGEDASYSIQLNQKILDLMEKLQLIREQ